LKTFYFFTDGASEPTNPGPSASAFCELSDYHDNRELYSESIFLGYATNNIAELKAIDILFDYIILNSNKYLSLENIIYVYADSQYALDCIRKWYPEWVRKNKLKDKKNLELIKSIYIKYIQITALSNIKLDWVKAHNGHWGNERADELCVKQCLDNAGKIIVSKTMQSPTEQFNALIRESNMLNQSINNNIKTLKSLYEEIVGVNIDEYLILSMIKEKNIL